MFELDLIEWVMIEDVLRSELLSPYGESMTKLLLCNGKIPYLIFFFLNEENHVTGCLYRRENEEGSL